MAHGAEQHKKKDSQSTNGQEGESNCCFNYLLLSGVPFHCIFPPGFPLLFLWFPMVLYGFPFIHWFLWVSLVVLWFSYSFLLFSPVFSFSAACLWRSMVFHGFPGLGRSLAEYLAHGGRQGIRKDIVLLIMVLLLVSYGFPMVFLGRGQ